MNQCGSILEGVPEAPPKQALMRLPIALSIRSHSVKETLTNISPYKALVRITVLIKRILVARGIRAMANFTPCFIVDMAFWMAGWGLLLGVSIIPRYLSLFLMRMFWGRWFWKAAMIRSEEEKVKAKVLEKLGVK